MEPNKQDKPSDSSEEPNKSPSRELPCQNMSEPVNIVSGKSRPQADGADDAPTVSPTIDGAGPHIPMETIIKTANNMSNMMIAHKIAIDKDFRLEPGMDLSGPLMSISPIIGSSPPSSGQMDSRNLHHQVKDIVHDAFWDLLREELTSSPPVHKIYKQIISDIKQRIMDLLLPQHTRLKQDIDDRLDLVLIDQQARNDALDIKSYGQFVVSTLSKLCAPIRDEKIKELQETDDAVNLYRGIMELLEMMRLDFANFTLNRFRPHIKAHSQEYEREKFKEILEQQKSLGLDGLEYTRLWLARAVESVESTYGLSGQSRDDDEESNLLNTATDDLNLDGDEDINKDDDENEDQTPKSSNCKDKNFQQSASRIAADRNEALINKILNTAYCELLEWTKTKQAMFPETLLFDQSTFHQLRNQCTILMTASSILLTTFAVAGQHRINLDEPFKDLIKSHVITLLTADYEKSSSSGASSRNASPNRAQNESNIDIDNEKMETIAVRIAEDIRIKRAELGHELPREFGSTLRRQILDLQSDRNRVRDLAKRRIMEFVETLLAIDIKNQQKKFAPANAPPVNIPLGLSCLANELTLTMAHLIKIVRYNRTVFLEHYRRLITELVDNKLGRKS